MPMIKPININTKPIELKVESIEKILEKATKHGAKLIPVLNLSDSAEIKTGIRRALKKYGRGVCLRIVSSDLEDTNKLNNELDTILKYLDTSWGNIDLLVDIKEKGKHYLKYFNLKTFEVVPRANPKNI